MNLKIQTMEREEFKQQFMELLKRNNPLNDIGQLFDKAVASGAIYIAGEPPDSLRLCKIVYYAILCEISAAWRPLDRQDRREAENLRLFL